MNAQNPSPKNTPLPPAADAVRTLLKLQGIAVSSTEAQALAKSLERLASTPGALS